METFGFQWHLTDRCNQRCAHCYQERWEPGAELGLADWRLLADRIFGSLADRLISVNLTGGEPLMLADLPALVEHLHQKSNLDEVWVITNGSLAPRAMLDRLAAAERFAGFKVSLESADESVNDTVRGKGNLARVRSKLSDFCATGKQVVLMTTLGSHNLAAIEATVAWARQQGVDGVLFERFVPLGHGQAMASQTLSEPQWRQAGVDIAGCAGETLSDAEQTGLKAYWVSFGPGGDKLQAARCNLGPGSMALMPNGTVHPCRRLPVPIGDALQESFENILERLAEYRPEPAGGCAALDRAQEAWNRKRGSA